MITFVDRALAQRQFNIYDALITKYKIILPKQQRRLDLMKEEKRELEMKNNFLSKLKLGFPVIGKQVEINKLQAWVGINEKRIPTWREKRDTSEAVLDQYNGEHIRD